jgi:pimeloyl-ACP methyl ester carboxylesterase
MNSTALNTKFKQPPVKVETEIRRTRQYVEAPSFGFIDANRKSASFNGFRFWYYESEHASSSYLPVLFISGAFQSMESWKNFAIRYLQAGFPVILVDLPGTGDSDPLPAEYGLDFLSDCILHLLNHIGCHKVSLTSASYGTPIAYSFAANHPSRVHRLILAGTMKEIPHHLQSGVKHTIEILHKGDMVSFANEVLGFTGPQKGNGLICTDLSLKIKKRRIVHRLLFNQLLKMSDQDKLKYEMNTLRLLRKEFRIDKPPSCPTLVFTGEHDTFTRPDFCREIAASIPDSVFTTIHEADHLFHLEQLEVTSNLILNFHRGLSLKSLHGIANVESSNLMPSLSAA